MLYGLLFDADFLSASKCLVFITGIVLFYYNGKIWFHSPTLGVKRYFNPAGHEKWYQNASEVSKILFKILYIDPNAK